MLALLLIASIIVFIGFLPGFAGQDEEEPGIIGGLVDLAGDVIGEIYGQVEDFATQGRAAEQRAADPSGPPQEGNYGLYHNPIQSEEFAQEVRFQKQCWLAANMLRIHDKVLELPSLSPITPEPRVTQPYYHHVILGQGPEASPADLTSLIVSRPNVQELMEIKPALLSYLMPHVKLYKIYGRQGMLNPEGEEYTDIEDAAEVEFAFDSRISQERVQDILTERRGRAEGVGLQSFRWDFLGVNPAEVENNIRASLKLNFNNMRDFEEERWGVDTFSGEPRPYRFSDLIVPEFFWKREDETPRPVNDPIFARGEDREFNPNFFRIKVVAGWSLPTSRSESLRKLYADLGMKKSFEEFLEIVRLNRKVMFLNLISHNIAFEQDGTMTVDAEYQALVEGNFSSPQTDILGVVESADSQAASREIETIRNDARILSYARSKGCELGMRGDPDPVDFTSAAELSEIQEQISLAQSVASQELSIFQSADRGAAYARLLEVLSIHGKIYTVELLPSQLGFMDYDPEEGLGQQGFGGDGNAFHQRIWREQGLPEVAELHALAQANYLEALQSVHGPEATIPAPPEPSAVEAAREALDEGYEYNPLEDVTPSQAVMRRMIAIARFRNMNTNFEVRRMGEHPGVACADIDVSAPGQGHQYAGRPVGVNPYLQQLVEDLRSQRPGEFNPDGNIVGTTIIGDDLPPGGSRQPGQGEDSRTPLPPGRYSDLASRIRRWVDRPYAAISGNSDGHGNRRATKLHTNFIFFGDLLDAVILHSWHQAHSPTFDEARHLQFGRTQQPWALSNNIEIYLGSFPYNDVTDYRNNANTLEPPRPTKYVPLAYIPISLELFSIWFTEEIVEANRTTMSLRDFIRSVFDKLIHNAFGEACVYDPAGEFFLTQEHFSVVPEFYSIPLEKLRIANMYRDPNEPGGCTYLYENLVSAMRSGERLVSLLDRDREYAAREYKNIVLYQAKSSDYGAGTLYETDLAAEPYIEVLERDLEKGIYHLGIGSDRGLVKSINFNRADQPYLREARLSAAGELGSLDQLRERYNATITMYGNMFFYPGQYIYINPSMVGMDSIPTLQSLTTKMGIGGYFNIKMVENIIEAGNFETILHCIWVTSGFKIKDPDTDETNACNEDEGGYTLSRDYTPSD